MRITSLAAATSAALLLFAGVNAIAPLSAQETTASKTLIPGKGADLTMARCAICHDITHVTRTRLSRGEWEFNVKNMIERGMPIAPEEIPQVVEYLATYYNREGPAPAPDPAADAGTSQDPVARLLAANACMGCHAPDSRIVGPSFREIAARYASDGGAAQKLAAKIKAGGAGVWGQVSMPPHPGLSDAELQQLAGWVLAQK